MQTVLIGVLAVLALGLLGFAVFALASLRARYVRLRWVRSNPPTIRTQHSLAVGRNIHVWRVEGAHKVKRCWVGGDGLSDADLTDDVEVWPTGERNENTLIEVAWEQPCDPPVKFCQLWLWLTPDLERFSPKFADGGSASGVVEVGVVQ